MAAPPRSLVPVVLVLLLVAGALALIGSGLAYCVDSFFLDASRTNVCASESRHECFVTEDALVQRASATALVLRHGDAYSQTTTVEPTSSWDEYPAVGTRVTLERWEGEEIAYVDDSFGRRHATNEAPMRGESVGLLVFLLLIGTTISVKTFEWLRGY